MRTFVRVRPEAYYISPVSQSPKKTRAFVGVPFDPRTRNICRKKKDPAGRGRNGPERTGAEAPTYTRLQFLFLRRIGVTSQGASCAVRRACRGHWSAGFGKCPPDRSRPAPAPGASFPWLYLPRLLPRPPHLLPSLSHLQLLLLDPNNKD